MKCKEFKEILNVMKKVVSHVGIYYLKNKIEIDWERCTLRAQNDTHMVEYQIDRDVLMGRWKSGTALVNIDDLKHVVSSANGEVKLYRKGDDLEVRAGRVSVKLSLDVTNAYMIRIEADMGEKPRKFAFEQIRNLFSKLSECVAKDDYQAVLNGIFLDKENGKAVATDGHRLLVTDLVLNPKSNMVIYDPSAFLKSIKGEEEIRVKFFDNHVGFQAGAFLIVSKTMEGEYPPWLRVIPKDLQKPVHLNIEDLKICKPIVNKGTKQIVLHFLNKGKLLLRGRRADASKEAVVESSYEGKYPSLSPSSEDNKVGFNLSFFTSLMKAMGGNPDICLGHNSSTAAVMKNEDGDLALIMPVKLS